MDTTKQSTTFSLLPLEAELIGRLKWLVQLRWVAVAGVSVTVLATRYLFGFENILIYRLFVLVFITAGINVIYSIYLSRSFPENQVSNEKDLEKAQTFAITQICIDLILLTLMIHNSGGVENPFSIFYIFHIIISSILLNRRYSIAYAFFVVFLYSGLILAENYGLIPHHHLIGIEISPQYLFGVIFAFGAAMLISAWVTSSIRMQLEAREDELEKARKALEVLEAQKSGFLRMVSHELRSPITAIQSSLGVIMSLGGQSLGDDLKTSLNRSMIRADELVHLTKDLLEFSRLTSFKTDETDLMDMDMVRIAQSVTELYESQAAEKNIQFDTSLPDDSIPFHGDPRSIDQIFNNIISNAIRYTPEHGRVKVSLEKHGDRARFTVTDNGIGIPPEDIERIGAEFYRCRNAKQFEPGGTGMGMKIVKEAVRQHGGKLDIQSDIDKGTTIRVEIPLTTGTGNLEP